MTTILINVEIIGVALLIWCVNHYLESKELNKIEREIQKEIDNPERELEEIKEDS